MILPWVLFVVLMIVGYTGISWFAQLSGGTSQSAFDAFLSAVRPFPLLVVTVANMFFALGIYYGFSVTRFAIPAAISIGVLTSFVYSVVVLGAQVTLTKVAGVAIVILGVAVLAL
jgi:hypothetical protein